MKNPRFRSKKSQNFTRHLIFKKGRKSENIIEFVSVSDCIYALRLFNWLISWKNWKRSVSFLNPKAERNETLHIKCCTFGDSISYASFLFERQNSVSYFVERQNSCYYFKVDDLDDNGHTPLIYAASAGRIKTIRELLVFADVNKAGHGTKSRNLWSFSHCASF